MRRANNLVSDNIMKIKIFQLFLTGAVFCLLAATRVLAQDDSQFSENKAPNDRQTRPNILRELNLSSDQTREIRRLNKQRRPLMQDAQERQRSANRRLDEAIYADNFDEQEIQSRLREVQTAHSEILKIRTSTESSIRRLLTADQLTKFRQLRENFEQTTRPLINRRMIRQNSIPADQMLQNRPLRKRVLRSANRRDRQ